MTANPEQMAEWTCPLCPAPPGWRLDWQGIVGALGLVRRLGGIPQDPAHHAEGDVLVHTRLVAEALTSLDEWRSLPARERSVVFLATLLHDVGKAVATREDDGALGASGHAWKGAAMAREALWRGDGLPSAVPFRERETIVGLVRWHGMPLWLLDRPEPERLVAGVSQVARLDWLAIVAEADVRGRWCEDQAALLDEVMLCRELAREQQCLTGPRAFASDHTRVLYFRNRWSDPDVEAHDDTRLDVVLMSGLPGAGKDTWVLEQLGDWPVVSLDAIRRELGVDPTGDQGSVVKAARERARGLMRAGRSFVWNATNVTRQIRKPLVDLFLTYGARVRIVYVDAPIETILLRNRQRESPVPDRVVDELVGKLDLPDLTEAHWVEYSG
jgi:predicted kinase